MYDVIGEEGFRRLVHGFYQQVPQDDVLGPLYAHADLEAAERRLRDFLVFRFGGPARYVAERGHPRLRLRHMPFPIDLAARDRWLLLMDRALDAARLSPPAVETLRRFFHDTAGFLVNRGDARS